MAGIPERVKALEEAVAALTEKVAAMEGSAQERLEDNEYVASGWRRAPSRISRQIIVKKATPSGERWLENNGYQIDSGASRWVVSNNANLWNYGIRAYSPMGLPQMFPVNPLDLDPDLRILLAQAAFGV